MSVMESRRFQPIRTRCGLPPGRDRKTDMAGCLKRANRNAALYSMTSSAVNSNFWGTSRPSAFATLILMIVSNLVG